MKVVSEAPSDCGTSVPPELASLQVSGPQNVEENRVASYTATASFSDGSTQVVTGDATWGVDSSAANISQGVLSAGEVAEDESATVSASYSLDGVVAANSMPITIIDTTQPNPELSHSGRFSSFEGTGTCLECHMKEAAEVHSSVHYQWKGDTKDVINAPDAVMGKIGGINDFCIYPDINWIGKLTNTRGESVDLSLIHI